MNLRLKLAGAFALVIAAGSVAAGLAVGAALRNRMQAFVLAADVDRARTLASYLADYHDRQGTLEGALDAVPPGFPDMPMMRRGPGRGRGGMGMMHPGARPPALVLLVDPRGSVLFASGIAPDPAAARETVARGVPVEAADGTVGYAAVGSMIDPRLRGLELDFLNSAALAVLFSSLGAAVLAVAAGIGIVVQLTTPLKTLERATERIAAGDFRHRVAVVRRDEIGELAGNFNRMASALEENERLRRKMVEDAAHELRTPVSLLKTNIDMMLEGVYPADNANLLSLSEEIGRLSQLVAGLDERNRSEGASSSPRMIACNVLPLVERALALHRAPLDEKGISVRKDLPDRLPEIEADPDRLLRVFANIVSNAVRHVNAGGVLTVTAGLDLEKSEETVGIGNSGSSVPVKDLERIFERFYRSDPARSRDSGGSGLGLSISREIVRLHGGRIWAENLSPDGVRFTVALPLPSARRTARKGVVQESGKNGNRE